MNLNIEKKQMLAWEEEYKHLKWGCAGSLAHIIKHISINDNILDAGCGSGRHLYPLSEKYRVTGIDIAQNALLNAKNYLDNQNKKANYVIANINNLPFRKDSFDVIICLGVLQHLLLPARITAVDELCRVLKKDGLIFFEVFGTHDMRFGGTEIEKNTFMRTCEIYYHYFSKQEIEKLFSKCKIIEIDDKISEKKYAGKKYIRHMISGILYNQK